MVSLDGENASQWPEMACAKRICPEGSECTTP